MNETAFLPAVGGRLLYSCMKSLALSKAPASVLFDRIKTPFLSYFLPLNFQPTELVKFHSLVRNPKVRFRQFSLTLQAQAPKSNLVKKLEIQLCDRLVGDVKHSIALTTSNIY